jgi:hypothetical protein
MTPGGFETSVRRAFSRTMEAHQRLEEISLSQFPGFHAQCPHCERLLESVLDAPLILFVHPDQDEVDIAGLKGPLGSLDHRTVHTVTMGRHVVRGKKPRGTEDRPYGE